MANAFTAIGLPDAYASKYNCSSQESALGGRGVIATTLVIFETATATKSRMDFESIFLNMMALLLSFYDTDRCDDGMAIIEPVGLYFSFATLCVLPSKNVVPCSEYILTHIMIDQKGRCVPPLKALIFKGLRNNGAYFHFSKARNCVALHTGGGTQRAPFLKNNFVNIL